MIDVIYDGTGWLATCDCAAWKVCPSQDAAWLWLLDHPCPIIASNDSDNSRSEPAPL